MTKHEKELNALKCGHTENSRYHVYVGNIGTVYIGNDCEIAHSWFASYRDGSERGIGRMAGESVVLFLDDMPELEYIGSIEQAELKREAELLY